MNAKFAQIRAETLKLNRRIGLRAALTPFAMTLGFMLSNPALADGKEYPGTMCEAGTDGFHSTPPGNIAFYLDGKALNKSTTSSAYFTCPLVRDAERLQANIVYAAVNVFKPSSEKVICWLYSNPYFGGKGWVQTKEDVSPAGLRLIEIPVQADSFTSGSFNVTCLLPKTVAGQQSGIAHYGIGEAD